jgi:hypothetical protein
LVQVGVAQAAVVQPGAGQVGHPKVSLLKVGTREIGIGQNDVFTLTPPQVGPIKCGTPLKLAPVSLEAPFVL